MRLAFIVIVDDFNMALTMNRLEPLYGLLPQSQSVVSTTLSSTLPSKKIKLGEYHLYFILPIHISDFKFNN